MALAILLAAAPGTTLASLIPVSQDRFVTASANASVSGDSDSDSDAASAGDFGLFDGTVDASALASAVANIDVAIAEGVANQTSTIGTDAVTAHGDASVLIELLDRTGDQGGATGDSFFEVQFMVDVPSSYALNGSVNTLAFVTGGAGIPLLGNEVILEDVVNLSILFQTLTNDEAFSNSGLLSPGTYRLRASAEIDASQESSVSVERTVSGLTSYNLDLQLTPQHVNGAPEPATLALLGLGLAGLGAVRRRKLAA